MSERDEVIAGRYRLVELIGRGAAGVVWRARDERLGRAVAVKLLNAADSPGAVERIMREGRVAARLRHPHAVTVHDVVEHEGTPCLVMEYLPSHTLAELIDDRGPLPEELVAGVGWQIASALAAAHADGIVHRDVTTFNILLGDDGTAKIADFGIARAIGENTVTDARVLVGTPAFLAPEVAAGQAAVFASDVYSLGATLYAALEGHPPFGNTDNPYALLRRVADGDVEPMRYPGPLGDVLERVLRRDPAERPTMAETHTLLGLVMEGRPLPGAPERSDLSALDTRHPDTDEDSRSGDTRPMPAYRRVPWRRIALIAAGVLLVATGIVIGNSLARRDSTSTAQPAPTTSVSVEAPTAAPTTNPATTTAAPTTTTARTVTTTSTTTPATTSSAPAATADCRARFAITNSWPGGYQAHVTVRNAGDQALTGWTVTWPRPEGHSISNLWNGSLTVNDSSVTVTNLSHNGKLAADGSTTFGFTANGQGVPDPNPTCASN